MVVRAAIKISTIFGIPDYVIGFTLVALGTSSPEIMISVMSSIKGSGDLALSNVLGSNVANIGLALSLSMLIAGSALRLKKDILKVEVPVLLLLHFLLLYFLRNAWFGRLEAGVLLAMVIATIYYLYTHNKAEDLIEHEDESKVLQPGYKKKIRNQVVLQIVLFLVGCVILYQSSELCVEYAVALARSAGLSERVIGITFIAIGTSLPEVATCVVAGLKGQHRISIGMILGSNLMNIGVVLGIAGLVQPFVVGSQGYSFDIWTIQFATLAVATAVMLGRNWMRGTGWVFLLGYLAYIYFATTKVI